MDRNPWIPQAAKLGASWPDKPGGLKTNTKQRAFLLMSDVNEVFYGGAAGGGKTYATLMAAAQFVDVPEYSALLLRENFGDLAQPGAWMPLSKAWWHDKARWNSQERRWYFPSGATITFGYLERDDDVYQYDTASYQFIAFDELVQHTDWRYRFMFGRLRRPMEGPLSRVPIRMRSASNPGGKGHTWVKNRFIDPKTRQRDCVFIPARLEDNAANMDTEAYRRDSLSKLDPILRRQRELGDWDAVAGGRFKKEWFEHRYTQRGDYIILHRPGTVAREMRWQTLDRFMTVDPAASEKSSSDWTVALVWLRTPWNELILWDGLRFQADIPDIVAPLLAMSQKWGCSGVWIEAVASNSAVYQLARRTTMPAKSLNPMGLDKLVRSTAAMNLASDGRIWLPQKGLRPGLPLEDIEAEWYLFSGDDKKDAHDDAVDCLSYAANILITGPTAAARNTPPMVIGGY